MVKEEGDERLEKMEVGLRRLERDSIRYLREIEIAEGKILKNQEKLEENKIAREEMMLNIEIQQITLDSIKSLQHN